MKSKTRYGGKGIDSRKIVFIRPRVIGINMRVSARGIEVIVWRFGNHAERIYRNPSGASIGRLICAGRNAASMRAEEDALATEAVK